MTSISPNVERSDALLIVTIDAERKYIELLVGVWLQKGYRTYSIWGDELLFCWPPSAWDEVKGLQDVDITLCTPIKLGGQIIGRIVLTGAAKNSVNQEFLDVEMSTICTYITMKTNFEQAARELVAQTQIKTEIDMAARIQQRLLPEKLPHIRGLDLYAHSRVAEQVGGEFYDFFVAQDHLVVAVGDVSGKGLPAALFMLMVRIALRTAAHALSISDPRDILVCANENLYDDFTERGVLATIFMGSYDADTRQLTYSNSAHSPVIYCPKDGQIRLLVPDTVPIGVLPTGTSLRQTIPFASGDLLVIGTDGVSECLNPEGEMFGNERLLKAVEALAHFPANQLGNKLFETIRLFVEDAFQADDQTFVIIKGMTP